MVALWRRVARQLLTAITLGLAVAGCAAGELEQPNEGEGWRLIGWVRGGAQVAPQIGADAVAALGELDLLRIGGAGDPVDMSTEVDMVVSHTVSGSCPQVRFDGLTVDTERELVEANLTDIGDLLYLGACSADANPVVYWLAVRRDILPEGAFTLRTEKAPDISTVVDLGDE